MFEDVDEEILKYVDDYHLHLLASKEVGDFSKFATELGKALQVISVSDDPKKFEGLASNDDFKEVGRETALLINECTGRSLSIPEGKETVNMCEAIKAIRSEAEIKGETRGETRGLQILVSTLKELGHDDSVILDEIVKRYKISRVAAEKYLI